MTDPMVAFVLARLDEDQVIAERNINERGLSEGYPDYRTYDGEDLEAADAFIFHFTGDRMLAETEAKRATIRMYEDALDFVAMMADHGREASHHVVAAESYLNVIRLWAAVHDNHPDYLPEWKIA
jgi:hypothetical protein